MLGEKMNLKADKYAKYIIVIVPIIWGINPVFMKIAYRYVDPLFMNFMRLFLAMVFSLVFTFSTKKLNLKSILSISRDTIRLIIFFGFFQLFFSLGIQYLPAGISGIVFGLLPVTVLIINTITGQEKSGFLILLSVLMSIIGIIIVMLNGGTEGTGEISMLGIVLIFFAQLSYGLFTIESKSKVIKYNPLAMTTVALIPVTTLFFLISLKKIFVFEYSALPFEAWGSIIFSGVIAIGFANAVWMWGTGKIGSTKVSLYTNINPVAALISGFFILGETLNITQFLGILVIFSAIVLSQIKPVIKNHL
jgi:drug/metabolite transporter (DMT)-like permease